MVKLSSLLIFITTLAFQEPQQSPSKKPTTKTPKPEVKLSCLPQIAMQPARQPATIWATLRVVHPNEAIWCSGIAWYLDEAFQGSTDSDCVPFEIARDAKAGELEWWSEDSSRQFTLWRGKHKIAVRLTKSGKVVNSTECVVYVE